MGSFNRDEFYEFILSNKVIGFYTEPIRLKSGRISPWYVNWRIITNDTYLIDKLTDYIISFAKSMDLYPKCFYGVPEGATKIAIILQYKWAKQQPDFAPREYPLPMGRGKPKAHGTPQDRYFIGMPKGETVIIEDVTTTGSSLLKILCELKALDIDVVGVISLTNREELTPIPRVDDESVVCEYSKLYEELVGSSYEYPTKIEKIMKKLGIKYYSLSTATILLPEACIRFKPSNEILKSVKEYFEKYSDIEVKLPESR